jgi:catechol 2,3-dioxygenase-like lactoylglutathione lyase family enzyme
MKTMQKITVPKIAGLSHIGLFVSDLPKALTFYHDFLGYEEQFQLTNPDGKVALKFMKINDRQFVELFPERNPEDERLYQVAFIVENIEAMRLHLKEHGVAVPEKYNKGRIGNLSFSAKDPDGHILEFVQYTPEGWTLQDTGKHLPESRISARLKHIGFTVRSLETSLAFYRDILGCSETWRGSSDGQTLSWVNMKLPESDEYLELMLYSEEPSRERKGIMNHMSLEVESVPESVEILKERAAGGIYERPLEHKVGRNKKRQINLIDPDGTRTELMEPVQVDGMSPEWFEPPARVK